jgi:hypothetical protein
MTQNQTWENWRAEQAIFLLGRREGAARPLEDIPKDGLF